MPEPFFLKCRYDANSKLGGVVLSLRRMTIWPSMVALGIEQFVLRVSIAGFTELASYCVGRLKICWKRRMHADRKLGYEDSR